jgi:hypothetical protein
MMRLLKNATNYFGTVSAEIQRRVSAFMDAPGYDTWDDIYAIILAPAKKCDCRGRGCTTVWQAVIAVEPTFPRSGKSGRTARERWAKYPDAMTVARAIKHATGG